MDEKSWLLASEQTDQVSEVVIDKGLYTAYITSIKGSGTHQKAKEPFFKCYRPRLIEPVVLMFYLAYSCAGPIKEQYVNKVIQDYYRNNHDWARYDKTALGEWITVDPGLVCTKPDGNETNVGEALLEDYIQSQASLWLMYIKLAGTIPTVLATWIICSYGDISGRKIGILLPPAGCAVKYILFVVATYLDSPIYLLFIGTFIEGILGSAITFLGSSYAYIADCTNASQRPVRFTILQTAITIVGLAHIPFGYWIDASGFRPPFIFVACVFIFTFVYILVMIPESHPPPEEKEESIAQNERGLRLIFQNAFRSFWIYSRHSHTRRRTQIALVLLFCAFICWIFGFMGIGAVGTLFMLSAPLCLNGTIIGYYNAINSFVHGMAGLIGTVLFLRCFTENPVCIAFSLTSIAGRIIFAFSNTVWLLFLVPFVSFGQNAVLPLKRALMSKLVSPQQQGALFATLFTVESVCDVFSGVVFNNIYAATVGSFKGLVFIIQAAILSLPIIFLLIYSCITNCRNPGDINYKEVVTKKVERD